MPRFGFTETEARALTDFLLQLRGQAVASNLPSLMGSVERGRDVFRKYGCAGCHGPNGDGEVPNPNAKTAQQVPGLKYVAEGYTRDELKKRILDGQREIPAMDPRKPAPPLYMPPWRGKIAEGELNDLVEFLCSLMPKGEKADF